MSLSFCTPKLSIFFLFLAIGGLTLLALFQNQSLPIGSPNSTWSLTLQQWQTSIVNKTLASPSSPKPNCSTHDQKLRDSVTFLPLKDRRFANQPFDGHTWFMSSMYDTREEGEVQYQQFPSESSKNRLLCLKGRDIHDGSWNYYALAWPQALPSNATLMKGLTFISSNYYDYENIWHSLSAMVPFVAWHIKNGCQTTPARWILYHWGELRFIMGTWINTVLEATFGQPPYIEGFNGVWSDDQPVCFEKAVVMRHNEGGMSNHRRIQVYDLLRCKARLYCNVSKSMERNTLTDIGMTLLLRTGARSFRNETAVIKIFENECNKVEGCRLTVAHSNNLTVCQQVKLMSLTDILISPHGAQLTNMFLMDRNSSVLEFFPKGWLKHAGVGQYVHHWLASWSGMRHQGAWRDPDGEKCPYPDDDRRCFWYFKNGQIGYDEAHFAQWARNVLNEVKARKLEEASRSYGPAPASSLALAIPNATCDCG